ncbi:MAG TPA: hypothetical protein VK449_07540 [Anaerolineales bacterium]|nr:hypothetical protein [Anaerolineales bacterium]
MTGPTTLVPLECVRCHTPVPAEPDEIAWICQTCGQGLLLDETVGLRPIAIQAAAAQGEAPSWKPFWAVSGRVRFSRRVSYGHDVAPEARWAQPVRFVVPAYATSVETAVALGVRFLERPPVLQPGEPRALHGASVLPDQIAPLVRFVVLSIEAARQDKLEAIDFTVELETPELWCLPSEGP